MPKPLRNIPSPPDSRHVLKKRYKKQKYPSTQKYYDIEIKADENQTVREVTWKIKQHKDRESEWGVYFLRTSLNINDEQIVWDIYNTIREIESSFRCLKTDLDLRPIY